MMMASQARTIVSRTAAAVAPVLAPLTRPSIFCRSAAGKRGAAAATLTLAPSSAATPRVSARASVTAQFARAGPRRHAATTTAAPIAEERPADPKEWTDKHVQAWFEDHEDGIWREYAGNFKRLNGEEMSLLSEEDFLRRADHPLYGTVIYNDWRRLVGAADADAQAASALWKTLRGNASAITEAEAGANVRVVTLPPDVEWMTEGDTTHMFVRECWERLYDIICGKMAARATARKKGRGKGVVVTGNPGIGKSWFLSYVMFRTARDEPHRSVVFESVAQGKLWVFGADGTVRVEDWRDRSWVSELDDPSTVYLFDPAGTSTCEAREPLRCRAFAILPASPDRCYYGDFIKHGGEFLMMPSWTLEELVAVAPHVRGMPSADEVERRYLRHGGISRAVLSDDPLERERELDAAIAACDLADVWHSIGLNDRVPGATHKVLVYDVTDATYTTMRARFASPSVARDFSRVLLMQRRSHNLMLSLLESVQGTPELHSVSSDLFEGCMHNMLQRGGSFRVRRLNGTPAEGDPGVLELPALRQVDVRTVKDLSLAASDGDGNNNAYYLPTVSNFPVVDALVRCDTTQFSGTIGLQATVSLNHPLDMARTEEILDALNVTKDDRFDLFFVVWPETFEDFEEQEYLTTADKPAKRPSTLVSGAVTQWALELPLGGPSPV